MIILYFKVQFLHSFLNHHNIEGIIGLNEVFISISGITHELIELEVNSI
jgi:hypothetical protein